MNVYVQIKNYLDDQKDILWGVAAVTEPEFAGEYPAVVVIAQKYAGDIDIANYDESAYHAILEQSRRQCEEKLASVKEILDKRQIKNLVPPPSQKNETELLAPFSFKYAALQAGIGWMGKNDLLITRAFGPRVLLRALMASVPFPCNEKPLEPRCGECRSCTQACSEGFIQGMLWDDHKKRCDLIHYQGCNRMRSDYKDMLGRKHSCGLCLFACPYGKAKE